MASTQQQQQEQQEQKGAGTGDEAKWSREPWMLQNADVIMKSFPGAPGLDIGARLGLAVVVDRKSRCVTIVLRGTNEQREQVRSISFSPRSGAVHPFEPFRAEIERQWVTDQLPPDPNHSTEAHAFNATAVYKGGWWAQPLDAHGAMLPCLWLSAVEMTKQSLVFLAVSNSDGWVKVEELSEPIDLSV